MDKSHDGILALRFVNLYTEFSFICICAYLPPENSTWGRDASNFYSHILHLVYLYNDDDALFICGDLNSRFGDKQETNSEIDQLPDRIVLDKGTNLHGDVLHEFLLDGKLCILNGRLYPLNDNYTNVTAKGKSVVDYFIVPHDVFERCIDFNVIDCESFVNDRGLLNLVSERCKIPDHSIVTILADVGQNVHHNDIEFSPLYPQNDRLEESSSHHSGINDVQVRYKLESIPENFLHSDLIRNAVVELIDKYSNRIQGQREVDEVYDSTCDVFRQEMDNALPRTQCSKTEKKMFKSHKPFWNDELKNLWKNMVVSRKAFERCEGNGREKREKGRF